MLEYFTVLVLFFMFLAQVNISLVGPGYLFCFANWETEYPDDLLRFNVWINPDFLRRPQSSDPVVAGGMLYVTAGNGGIVGTPGNILLAFEVVE